MKKLFSFLCLLVVVMNTSTTLADTSYFSSCIGLNSVTIQTNGSQYNIFFYTNDGVSGYSNPWTVNNISFTNVITGTTNYSNGYAYYIFNDCTMATVSGNGGQPYRYELESGSVTFTYTSNGRYDIHISGYDGMDYYDWTGTNVPVTLPNTLLHPGQAMTVTLNANTANHGSGSNTNATVTLNAASLTGFTATSTATGYTLEGYYTAATSGTKVLNANGTYAAANVTNYITNSQWTRTTSTTTLYAHMTANTYSVTLDKGTGGTSNGSATATYNSSTLTSVNHATKTGSPLLGYYTAASDGTKVINANGTLVANVSGYTDANGRWIRASATTLYAQWGTGTYTITLDKGTDGTANGTATATYNSNTITSVTHATKSGWSLTGYYTAATDGTMVINADGTLVANVDGYTGAGGVWTRSSDATLYAQWTSISTITLDKGTFGTANGTATIALHSTTFTSLVHATFPGVQLDGYYVNKQEQTGSRTKIINADGTLVPNTGYVNENGEWNCIPNITLYAHWRRYLVSYIYNVGYPHNDVSNPVYYIYEPGETISLVDGDVPGFEFQGWYLDDTYQTKVTEIDRSWIPEDGQTIRLYAKFSDPIVYKLTYSIPDGVAAPSPANPTTYTIADLPITLNAPGTREHYTFTYWKTDPNNLLTSNQITRNNIGNYSLIAGWAPNDYSLTVHCQKGMAVWVGGTLVTDDEDLQVSWPYDSRTQISFDLNETNRDYAFNGIEITLDGEPVDLDHNDIWEWYSHAQSGLVSDRGGYVTLKGNTVITYKSTNLEDAIWYSYLPGMIDHCDPDPDFPDDRTKDHCVMISDYWQDPDRLTQTVVFDIDEPVNTIKDLSSMSFGDGQITWGGWYTDAALTTPIGTPAIPAHAHFTSYPHFYAKWNAPIQYRDKGGTAYSGSTTGLPVYDYWCGPDVALPNPAARTGYTFGGWYDNSDCTGDPITVVPDDYSFHASNTNLPVVYANWTAMTYAITLDKGTDGTTDGSATASYDSNTLTDKTDAVKTGWSLLGYFTDATEGIKVSNADGTLIANVDGYTGENGIWIRTSATTLYAQWSLAIYTVTLESSNTTHGRVLSGGVEIGEINNVTPNTSIVVDGATLTIDGTTVTATPSDANGLCTYSFECWKNGGTVLTGSGNVVSEDMTITAHFTLNLKDELTLNDLAEASYYDSLKTLYNNRDMVAVTYNRTFTEGNWSTLCLPFEVNQDHLGDNGLTNQVFRFNYAVGDAEVGSGIELHFGRTNTMMAGLAYLVKTDVTTNEPFIFDDVTINTTADTQDVITDLTGYNNGTGTITLVGTLRKGKLPQGDKHYMGLSGNKIYYPGSNATVPAYRAFFKESNPAFVAPRVRMVFEDEHGTPIEVIEMDGEGNLMPVSGEEVRKYIEDGVLIIERNGKRYTAQGAEL